MTLHESLHPLAVAVSAQQLRLLDRLILQRLRQLPQASRIHSALSSSQRFRRRVVQHCRAFTGHGQGSAIVGKLR